MTDRLTLAELRKQRGLTQVGIAPHIWTSQSGVAAIERRADVLVSTLDAYVSALGGTLKLVAVFPDAECEVELGRDQPGAVPPVTFSGPTADLFRRRTGRDMSKADVYGAGDRA